MTKTQRAALIYGGSVFGAGCIAILRGRTEISDFATDAIVHGVIAGTVFNVIGLVSLPEPSSDGLLTMAKANTATGLGKLGAEGVKALSGIDVDRLYANMKSSGVKIAPLPANPSIVTQDET
jgi:hypothetical protein